MRHPKDDLRIVSINKVRGREELRNFYRKYPQESHRYPVIKVDLHRTPEEWAKVVALARSRA